MTRILGKETEGKYQIKRQKGRYSTEKRQRKKNIKVKGEEAKKETDIERENRG